MNEAAVHHALASMSDAFAGRDAMRLLALFSARPTATYVGSEIGEVATGSLALESLFRVILERPVSYAFKFDDVVFDRAGECVWLVADGHGIERRPDAEDTHFPYRVTGVLVEEASGWRWNLLAGSEPTAEVT